MGETATSTIDITTLRLCCSRTEHQLRKTPIIYVTRHKEVAFVVVDHGYLSAMLERLQAHKEAKWEPQAP